MSAMVAFCERQVSGGGGQVHGRESALGGRPVCRRMERTKRRRNMERRGARLAPEAGHGAALIAVGMKLNAFR